MMSKNTTFFVILDKGRNHDITPGKTKSEYIVTVPRLNSSNETGKSSASKECEGDTLVLQFQIRFVGTDEIYSTFKL
jgi:hypothetical protein